MDIDSVYRLYFRDVFLFLQGLTHNEALAEELLKKNSLTHAELAAFFEARQKNI